MRSLPALLVLLVLAHAAWGLLRVPHAVVARRLREINAIASEGDAAVALHRAYPKVDERIVRQGADAIATLRSGTPQDAVIVVRGALKGALELAPAMLWPRLCCREELLPAAATEFAGRPVAAWVLVGDGPQLRLEQR